MNRMRVTASILFIITIFNCCVPTKKYNELILSQDEVLLNNRRLEQTQEEYLDLRTEYAELKKRSYNTEKGLKDLIGKYEALNQRYNDLKNHYEGNASIDELAISPVVQELNLKKELAALKAELEQKQTKIWDLEMELDQKGSDQESTDLTTPTNPIIPQEETGSQNSIRMISLNQAVEEALASYASGDLTISINENQVFVLLPQDLLFEKGSKDIADQGQKAIAALSSVLRENSDIAINIEGHTDSDGNPAYNWDLSVTRATSVVRELISLGIDATRLTASGRSHYDPIDTNATSAGKARNRRVEIILTEHINQSMDLIKN